MDQAYPGASDPIGVLEAMPSIHCAERTRPYPGRGPYGIRDQGGKPDLWVIEGVRYQLDNQHGLHEAVSQQVQRTLWGKMAASRTSYQGLEEGRNHRATLAWRETVQDDRTRAFLDIVLTDAVYTPLRAHLRWGKDGGCPSAGMPQGTGSMLSRNVRGCQGHRADRPSGPAA